MKNLALILIVLFAALAGACGKTYTCECFNPGGVFKTFEIKGSKAKATRKCDDYSKEYQTVPMSETACVIR
ncbi:MAG: hypothetical protein V4635_00815 [Bacteroidota bacterium]